MNDIHTALVTSPLDSDCIGHYDKADPLCAKHCVLRLRCAIEHDHIVRANLIEDLVGYEDETAKIQ